MTHIAGHDRSQTLLLPESLDDYVSPENPVRFIEAFVVRPPGWLSPFAFRWGRFNRLHLMRTYNTLFTTTEAAVLAGLPLKAVNNAIDKKMISAAPGPHGTRLLDARALVSLSLERRLSERLTPELRRKVFAALAGSPRNVVSLEGGLVKIDLREPRRELAASLRDLRRARRLVVSDPDIMDGDPVFRGTRVPVHMIAELLAQGSNKAELRESYPRLTAEMIRLAPIYAAAYPMRGRPRYQPWRDHRPTHRARRRMSSIMAS